MAADDLPPQRKPRGAGRRFAAGQSGNPAGPRPGTRHPAFAALDAVGMENVEDVIRGVRTAAIAGDMRAAEILLRRCWPERRGRPLRFDMPAVVDAHDLPAAMAAVSAAMSAGELTPEEATAVSAVLETHRRVIDTHDLAERITALEAAQTEARGKKP